MSRSKAKMKMCKEARCGLDYKTVVFSFFLLARSQRHVAPKASEAWIPARLACVGEEKKLLSPVLLSKFTLAPDLSFKDRAHSYDQRKK